MDDDRLNSPSTSAVILELFGHKLQISQDPNSKHLGTTVWDASMVFVKYLERNSRKGRFSASKLKGKRAIELGAGCGLSGFGMALLGCDVVSTDQVEVLPLLMRNIERNICWINQANADTASVGSITVAELDWGNKDHIIALEPPFDYIIGTDVVYAEHLLDPLLQTIIALSGPKTTILLGYEIRSTSVHEKMMHMWRQNFQVKSIPQAKMDYKYRHHSIQLFLMEQKLQPKSSCENNSSVLEVSENKNELEETEDVQNEKSSSEGSVGENDNANDWEIRRCGAMAARLLKDVKIK